MVLWLARLSTAAVSRFWNAPSVARLVEICSSAASSAVIARLAPTWVLMSTSDSFMPLSGLVELVNMQIGEVIFEVENWSVYHPQHIHRQVVKNLSLKVRAGVKWNNGDDFTADDVANNLTRWCDGNVEGNSMATRMGSLVENNAAVAADIAVAMSKHDKAKAKAGKGDA